MYYFFKKCMEQTEKYIMVNQSLNIDIGYLTTDVNSSIFTKKKTEH